MPRGCSGAPGVGNRFFIFIFFFKKSLCCTKQLVLLTAGAQRKRLRPSWDGGALPGAFPGPSPDSGAGLEAEIAPSPGPAGLFPQIIASLGCCQPSTLLGSCSCWSRAVASPRPHCCISPQPRTTRVGDTVGETFWAPPCPPQLGRKEEWARSSQKVDPGAFPIQVCI